MYKQKKISVVIPCFNEREGIAQIIKNIAPFVDEILVVDSSTDDSGEVAEKLGARVVREDRRGYGRAYKTGFAHVKGDIAVTMDADGTYPLWGRELSNLLDAFIDKNYDFVSCTRFPMKFDSEIMPIPRIFGNKFLTFMSNFLFRGNFKDILSGMWIFKKEIVPKLKLVDDTWSFSEEIKIEAFLDKTINFGEIHIPYRVRIGTSKLNGAGKILQSMYYPYKIGFHNLFFMFKMKFKPNLFKIN